MISNELKSIHIDLEKGIYLINGKEIKMISFMQLEFDDGEWSLETTRTELYSSKATPNVKRESPLRD